MPIKSEVVHEVRRLRNTMFANAHTRGSSWDALRYRCGAIGIVADKFAGQIWDSTDMPDPIQPDERGHSVGIIPHKEKEGFIVSLTGRVILGTVANMDSDESVRDALRRCTKGYYWKKLDDYAVHPGHGHEFDMAI